MIFTVVAAFLLAALSGMGVGGGGLFVVFLSLFSDLPQITIQGINLLFFIFSSGAAVLIHVSRRHIFGKAVLTMIVFGILGSLLGIMLVATGVLGMKRR